MRNTETNICGMKTYRASPKEKITVGSHIGMPLERCPRVPSVVTTAAQQCNLSAWHCGFRLRQTSSSLRVYISPSSHCNQCALNPVSAANFCRPSAPVLLHRRPAVIADALRPPPSVSKVFRARLSLSRNFAPPYQQIESQTSPSRNHGLGLQLLRHFPHPLPYVP